MKLYKRIGENGFEHIVQAESDEVAAHMGLLPLASRMVVTPSSRRGARYR